MKQRKHFLKRSICGMLTFAMCLSGIGIMPGTNMEVKAADTKIQITSADDLAKIGSDSNYPMNGDYELTADIDLSGRSWTPIGGAAGPEYALVSGDRVFSGTFDGKGHSIDGLTITYDGSADSSNKAHVSGLFAMIGSNSADDYAEVKNIVFKNVSITHTLGTADTIGTLTGDANGYVKIDNIAVLSGSVAVAHSNVEDLIGIGGIVGQVRNNQQAVQLSNLYNAASVTVPAEVVNVQERCGGILGRIHQSGTIGSLSSCVNVGTVSFRGNPGYAINGVNTSGQVTDAAIKNITNCFYLNGSGKDMGASSAKTAGELAGQDVINMLGGDYWEVENGSLIPSVQKGKVPVLIPSPEFAEGDRASSVTKNFTVPLTFTAGEETENITWTSSNENVISIDAATGVATVFGVLADTDVTLTGTTSVSRRTKTVVVTVRSDLKVSVDQKYAKPGVEMTASIPNAPEGTEFTYQWNVETKGQTSVVSNSASYTPNTTDLNKFISVTAMLDGVSVDTFKLYCSKLPVVYIDTEDGYGITSKEVYKDATMRVQGNDKFQDETTLYDGAVEIRGRGNSTWNTGFNKLPYKLKLGTKTNLLGFGTSKHWALLANYMDESLIRNTTSYDLAGKMGITPHLKSTHVELILNGVYAGNYQLVGNVRVDGSRVDIFNWEDTPEDAAKAIASAEGLSKSDRSALEDQMNENMEWITSDSVTYNGKTYQVSKYYNGLPKNADGSINTSGGFLFELDSYYDEVSKFKTTYNQPIMFKNPEFVNTNQELFTFAKKYIQAVEDSVHAADFYADYDGGKKHYTELVDLDSLVRYLILNEVYWNTETMKKSTYMYKDLDDKLHIGPVWDMDWTSNSLVSASETGYPDKWMVTTRSAEAQAESWYKYLIGDPYFVQKMLECYNGNRENFDEIVKTGGIIDQDKEYLAESAAENYSWGYLQNQWNQDAEFNRAAERLRSFLSSHLSWMDQQFASLDTLLTSLGKYKSSNEISVTASGLDTGAVTTFTANVTDSNIAKVAFYVNGIQEGIVDVAAQKAELTSSDTHLERKKGARNVVQVRAMDASGNLISNVTNYAVFDKELPIEALTGTVKIQGAARARVGSVLSAELTGGKNTGTLSYQWKADGKEISGATYQTYTLTEKELGKTITVEVTSSVETGTLESAATAAILDVIQNDHLLVHQVFGGGENDGSSISHSFIELYNPTEEEVSLDGYKIGYFSGRTGAAGYTEEEVYLTLDGQKTIPPHHSYLIRCEAQQTTNPDTGAPITFMLNVDSFDQEWTLSAEAEGASGIQVIANKRYKVVLYHGTDYVDGVSVNEEAVEGTPLLDPVGDEIVSKHKSVRRKNFADTDNNSLDFETVNYKSDKITSEKLEANRPRTLADGAWEAVEPDPPAPDVLSGTVSVRGNAIVGAILYADVVLDEQKNTYTGALAYQWKVDGAAAANAASEFFTIEESHVGKKISVEVTCPDSEVEGTLAPAALAQAVKAEEAQREHIIINQVYGDGGKKDVPISHSFIELYNPTSEEIDLSGYGITYVSADQTMQLALDGKIPSRSSYLIRGAEGKALSDAVKVDAFDKSWDLSIGNKQYSVVLKNGETYVDGVAVNENPVEGNSALVNPVGDEIISKNKAVRRIAFIDTDNNVNDFEVLNYSKLPADLKTKAAPRSTKDGAWGLAAEAVDPNPPTPGTLTGTVSILGDAVVGSVLSVKAETNNTGKLSYQWQADGEDIANATGTSLGLTADHEGKLISVTVKSSVETGTLTAVMSEKVQTAKPLDPELLADANQMIAEAEGKDASKYEKESYEKMLLAKEELEAAIAANDAERIKTAMEALRTEISNLKEITSPDDNIPSEKLLADANQAISDVEKLDASKYDPSDYANLTTLKNALENAMKENDAQKIQNALSELKNALSSIKPNTKDPDNQVKLPAVGTKFLYNKNWYKITKSAASGGTAVFVKPGKKTEKTVTIPNEAVYENIKFKVTKISKKAFKNNKKLKKVTVEANVTNIEASAFAGAKELKTIIIKSKTLKKVGKNALKGIHAKCKIKVPKKQLKSYTKKFKKKGQKSTVKVVS